MKERLMTAIARDLIKKHGNGKKIALKFTGLRAGEKLKERLFTKEEASHMLETKTLLIITPHHLVKDFSYPPSNYPGSRKASTRR
jgi:FlaA1/EpsC-like NDP-sugar epimerase